MEQMEVGVITQEKKISIHCLGLFQRYGDREDIKRGTNE